MFHAPLDGNVCPWKSKQIFSGHILINLSLQGMVGCVQSNRKKATQEDSDEKECLLASFSNTY